MLFKVLGLADVELHAKENVKLQACLYVYLFASLRYA